MLTPREHLADLNEADHEFEITTGIAGVPGTWVSTGFSEKRSYPSWAKPRLFRSPTNGQGKLRLGLRASL
jgi:hypothetical protein